MDSRDAEIARLSARLREREAQARRDTERINDAEETTRVYRRALYRKLLDLDALTVECERLRMRLATFEQD